MTEDVGLPQPVYEFPWFIWDVERSMGDGLPPVLYHYTSATGLLEIVQSRTLWATDPRYMNDASELEYPLRIARDAVEEALASEDHPIAKSFRDKYLALEDPIGPDRHFYVACFCENGDLLSQWRAYGGGASGYAIGFDPKLLKLADDAMHNWWLTKMHYDTETFLAHIVEIARSYAAHLKWAEANYGVAVAERAISLGLDFFTRLLINAAVSIKHSAFAEEREWRFIHYSWTGPSLAPKPEFRVSGPLITPYIALTFDQCGEPIPPGGLPIKGVWCGPSSYPDLNAASVQRLLLKHGYTSAHVRHSAAPVRL